MGLIGEHGLSLWIETAEACVLFDTGQGLALPQKVWKDCIHCPKFPNCDETAMLLDLVNSPVPTEAIYAATDNV